ncbi:hypothetical protein [Kaistia defluvii]|jgi:hypothetical protein|uniref:Lipoprotein n=1 Tax=Kaistia defluvii TaxID=410841 RepID=A0ABV2R187_9HYPH
MKSATLLTAAGIVLAGCVSSNALNVIYKEGSSRSQRVSAVDACRIEGLRKIPQALTTEYSPEYSKPGAEQCRTTGTTTKCRRVGTVSVPGKVPPYDKNQKMRERFMTRCLTAKGFGFIEVPQCVMAKDKKAVRKFVDRQPPRSQIACWPADYPLHR